VIRVLVAADSAIVRAGLAALLSESSTLTVVGTVVTAATIAAQQPDVVLLDWDNLEEEGVLPFIQEIDEHWALPWVLLVDRVQSASWVSEALRLNVRGILPREAIAAELIAAIEGVAAGLAVLHPDILELLMPNLPTFQPQAFQPQAFPTQESGLQGLTPREIQVLSMLAEGLGNKAIAKRLQISEHTVKFHVGSIFGKLNASSRTEAVTLGAKQGLILL
jgi:two-component system, NarL family, response regulator YdfI